MKKKRWLATCSIYHREAVIRKLEAMAREGWQLQELGMFLWTFVPMEPKRMHYAVAYDLDGDAYDPNPPQAAQEKAAICREDGWEPVAYFKGRRFTPMPENPRCAGHRSHRGGGSPAMGFAAKTSDAHAVCAVAAMLGWLAVDSQ